MIGSLRGTVLDRSPRGEMVLEVAGVGYRVTVSPATLTGVGDIGAEVRLYTHLLVREDALSLFGFSSRGERDCFEVLLATRGVGPALAMAILAVHTPGELARLVAEGDMGGLTLVPGLGPKSAARLMIELKSRLTSATGDDFISDAAAGGNGHGPPSVRSEVRAALGALGYGDDEVRSVMAEIASDGAGDGGTQGLLRAALKALGARR